MLLNTNHSSATYISLTVQGEHIINLWKKNDILSKGRFSCGRFLWCDDIQSCYTLHSTADDDVKHEEGAENNVVYTHVEEEIYILENVKKLLHLVIIIIKYFFTIDYCFPWAFFWWVLMGRPVIFDV